MVVCQSLPFMEQHQSLKEEVRFQEPVKKEEEERLSLRRNPRRTLYHFTQALGCFVKSIKLPAKESLYTLIGTIGVVGAMFVHAKSGNYGTQVAEACANVEQQVLEAMWWVVCGILSTAGMGFGLQTGALFLFPHVAQQALHTAASDSTSSLLWAAFWPGFWAGTGSAIGELVPFLLARAIRRAGGDPFSLLLDDEETTTTTTTTQDNDDDDDDDNKKTSSWWTPRVLLANSRNLMERQLATGSFWKIFILASIPNALFDLCGLVCGSMNVMSLGSFFLAVWSAKAFVRTPLQTCSLALTVAAAASKRSESNDNNSLLSWVHDLMEQFTTTQSDVDEESGAVIIIIKTLWSFIACAMFAFFVLSTVEHVAQHHEKSQRRSHTTK